MNLYLFIAIALGAMTGIREVPVARPAFEAVVAKSSVRAERQSARASIAVTHATARSRVAVDAVPLVARADAPLTGAASPRAPSSLL